MKITLTDSVTMVGLQKATRALKANSSAGFDGVTPRQFRTALMQTDLAKKLIEDLKVGRYRPGLLRRVLIPKQSGKFREIFIPSVQDRVVQKMIAYAITPLVEACSSQYSFGFRPHRNVQQAVKQVSQWVRSGYHVCLQVDLENFFGNINRERLRTLLRNYPMEPELRELVNAFMKAKTMDMIETSMSHGIPAGIPLAPLLANIYLTPLDNELTKRGVKFVRYADDITLLFRSEHECRSFNLEVSNGWEERFGIRINHQKTEIVSQGHRSVLGFKIGDYGGVTVSTAVADSFSVSLADLLPVANVPLSSLIEQTKIEVGRIKSKLAHYAIADNYHDLIAAADFALEPYREKIALEYSILELLEQTSIRIRRVYEATFYSPLMLAAEILPMLGEF